MEELWAELSAQLNALKGPTRNPIKWRENLTHWKNQVRSHARKAKAHNLVTGGGPSSTIELSEMEQRALDTLGSVAVDGLTDVPAIGTEEEVVFTAAPSPLNTTSDASNYDTPSSSRRKKMTTDEMFRNYMDRMKGKAEEERDFRIKTLDSIIKYTESINNLAAVMVSLAQTIVKKTEEKK
ncbi:uncharacterized protein LOC125776743 [Bactrocera dorsalis]|uniref:Uncharacterized protein LOC125776743 n=1 Tax=Bactrocera dorsalis TaxID=27457 RepID=A0ABM3JAK7_BACDO|nr:uncharacterized protein LOC125776743 [Bactrocera dorsalis]